MKKAEYGVNRNIFFRQLKIARHGSGMSQATLATKMQVMGINIDQQMISKIEQNKRFITDYELACICFILHIDEKELFKDFYTQINTER